MKKSRFVEPWIFSTPKEGETGIGATDICRGHAATESTHYSRKARYECASASTIKQMKELSCDLSQHKRKHAEKAFTGWREESKVHIDYIQLVKPTQNAFIERFSCSLRREASDLNLSEILSELGRAVERQLIQHNDQRSHDSLGGLPPSFYAVESQKESISEAGT